VISLLLIRKWFVQKLIDTTWNIQCSHLDVRVCVVTTVKDDFDYLSTNLTTNWLELTTNLNFYLGLPASATSSETPPAAATASSENEVTESPCCSVILALDSDYLTNATSTIITHMTLVSSLSTYKQTCHRCIYSCFYYNSLLRNSPSYLQTVMKIMLLQEKKTTTLNFASSHVYGPLCLAEMNKWK